MPNSTGDPATHQRGDDLPRPSWDLRALNQPTIVHATGRDETSVLAAAALDAQARGDPAAPALVRRLAEAGVVAVRAGRRCYLCRETATSWVLLPTHRHAGARALAAAAIRRAHRLADLRHRARPHPPAPRPRDLRATADPENADLDSELPTAAPARHPPGRRACWIPPNTSLEQR